MWLSSYSQFRGGHLAIGASLVCLISVVFTLLVANHLHEVSKKSSIPFSAESKSPGRSIVPTVYPHPSVAEDSYDMYPFNTHVYTEVTMQPPEYKDWRTYQNEEFGFRFKYPPIWQYRVVTDEERLAGRGTIVELLNGAKTKGEPVLRIGIPNQITSDNLMIFNSRTVSLISTETNPVFATRHCAYAKEHPFTCVTVGDFVFIHKDKRFIVEYSTPNSADPLMDGVLLSLSTI